jgi:hypothetical protein
VIGLSGMSPVVLAMGNAGIEAPHSKRTS